MKKCAYLQWTNDFTIENDDEFKLLVLRLLESWQNYNKRFGLKLDEDDLQTQSDSDGNLSDEVKFNDINNSPVDGKNLTADHDLSDEKDLSIEWKISYSNLGEVFDQCDAAKFSGAVLDKL
jgi:hypothetical protein